MITKYIVYLFYYMYKIITSIIKQNKHETNLYIIRVKMLNPTNEKSSIFIDNIFGLFKKKKIPHTLCLKLWLVPWVSDLKNAYFWLFSCNLIRVWYFTTYILVVSL